MENQQVVILKVILHCRIAIVFPMADTWDGA
jgi:hypothetical protein